MSKWEFTRFQQLADPGRGSFSIGPFGSAITADNYVAEGVPVVRGVNLAQGIFVDDQFVFISSEKADELARANLKPGDLIFTHRGTIGQVSMIPRSPRFDRYVLSSSQVKARLDPNLAVPEFYYYWLKSEEGQRLLLANASTVGVPGIASPLATIKSQLVPYPSLLVQNEIASVLGALDGKIVINKRILRASYDLMKLKYANAIRSGTKTTAIGAIVDVFDGPHATPKKTDSGPWFLSISSLVNGRLVLEESAHLAEPDFERWTRRVTPTVGDVLFSYETRLGEAALMPTGIRACLGRRMALMRPRDIGPRTLLQAFLSPSFQETIKQYAVHGATVDRIPLTEFPSWQIGLPIHEPQQLESVLRHLDELAEQRERENETLAEIRDALLPKLMSGEIRVQDAEKVIEEVT